MDFLRPGKSSLNKMPTRMLTFEKPLLVTRIKATFIDTLVVILFAVTLFYIFDAIGPVSNWVKAACFFLAMIYDPLFTSTSRTLGQRMMNIRVVDHEALVNDGELRRINFFKALFRIFVKGILGIISFFSIHLNEEKRAIHDYISGSIVIQGMPQIESSTDILHPERKDVID